MSQKISDLTAKGANLQSSDILEVSVSSGGGYVSRKITGSELRDVTFNQQTSNYVLSDGDENCLIEMNLAGANTLTIPSNTLVPFAIGTQILVSQYGAGQTTIAGAVGVTLRSSGGKTKIAAQYGMASLIKRDTDEWYLAGDITT